MAEFEEKLNAILSDPQAMGQIMAIAKALGASGEGDVHQEAAPPSKQPPKTQADDPLSSLRNMDSRLVQTALRLFSEYTATDDRRAALLTALQPFLKEERHAKVDKAVQIAKLSRVARVAFHLLKGEDDYV